MEKEEIYGKKVILVARDQKEGKVIGFQEIRLHEKPKIEAMFVHPKYRRKGLASSFHGLSQIIAAEAGYKEISHSHVLNLHSKKALQKAGIIKEKGYDKITRTKTFRKPRKII